MGYNSLGNIFFFGAGMYICAVVQIGLLLRRRDVHVGRAHHAYCLHHGAVFHRIRARNRCGGHYGRNACRRDVMDRVRTARALFRDRHARRSGCGRRAGGLLGMGRRCERAYRCRYFPARRKRKSCSSISCSSHLPSSCCFFCGGSTRRISAWPSMRSATTRKRPKRWASTRAATSGRRWAIAAFFLGIAGAIFGNMTGFIEPRDIAFPDHDLQYLHDPDGAARRQGHVLGAGRRRGRLPRHQGSDLDLFPRLAVRRARPADRRSSSSISSKASSAG